MHKLLNNKKILPYLLILPVSIWLGLTIFYPIFDGIRLSFLNIDIPSVGKEADFVFIDNYIKMFNDSVFWHSFRVTLIYAALFVIGTTLISISIALFLNLKFKGRAIFRTLIILPWAVPYVVAVLVWRWILDYNFGIINFILKDVLHIVSENIEWMLNPKIAIFTVVIITIWKEFPIAAVMYLAGLQAIPLELYEAASVDGANNIRKFFHITLPQLKPVNTIVILLLTIWGLKRVTAIYVLTKGGPAMATQTLVIQSYLNAFSFFKMSYAATIGVFMLVLSLIISLIYLKLTLGKGS